jgi:hypothetical protein
MRLRSRCRNRRRRPLYGFSCVGLAGIGLLTGSFVWLALLVAGAALYFGFVVRREEILLRRAFPGACFLAAFPLFEAAAGLLPAPPALP